MFLIRYKSVFVDEIADYAENKWCFGVPLQNKKNLKMLDYVVEVL